MTETQCLNPDYLDLDSVLPIDTEKVRAKIKELQGEKIDYIIYELFGEHLKSTPSTQINTKRREIEDILDAEFNFGLSKMGGLL